MNPRPGLAISLIILPVRDEPGLAREATMKFLVTPLVTRRAQFRNTRRDTPIGSHYCRLDIPLGHRGLAGERERKRSRGRRARFVTLPEETEARYTLSVDLSIEIAARDLEGPLNYSKNLHLYTCCNQLLTN